MMKRGISMILIVAMVWLGVTLVGAEQAPITMIDTYFHAPGEANQFHHAFPYSDAYFSLPSDQYHHELAQASIGFAVSAFRKAVDDLCERDENVKTYLDSAGFANVRTEQYDMTPTIDTIATAIGAKQIGVGEDSYTLIALGVSGAGYEAEWESNFSIGDGDEHEGFAHAAGMVIDRIKAYISDHQITGRMKLWITGYSRAAAVSNLTAAKVHEDDALAFDAIYAYTFATPNTTKAREDYAFIYNVVGQFDPVPTVPFHKWGYDRHGTTLYLPAREVNIDYAERAQRPSEIYANLTDGETFWVNPEANWLVHKLMEFLSDFVRGTSDYAAHYQQIFIDTYSTKGSIFQKLKVCAKEIMKSSSVLSELSEEKREFFLLLSQESYDAVLEKIGWRSSDWNRAEGLSSNIMHEHFPQVYVSWIMAYDTKEQTFSDDTGYKRVAITGPVDLEILEGKDDVPVVQVQGGTVHQLGNRDLPVMYVGDELLITLPGAERYEMKFTTRKDGTLEYMVKEQYAGYVATRTLEFEGVPVKKSGEMVSLVDAGEMEGDRYESLLIDQDMNVYKPTHDSLRGEDPSVNAASDIDLTGNDMEDFLLWALVAAGCVLVIALLSTVLGVRHHRRKKRGRATKTGAHQP